jgi:hypothetical protein
MGFSPKPLSWKKYNPVLSPEEENKEGFINLDVLDLSN